MDKKDSPFDPNFTRSLIGAVEEAWQLPRVWFACWWNVVVDSWWPPHDFARHE